MQEPNEQHKFSDTRILEIIVVIFVACILLFLFVKVLFF
jgi:competence protein ComGC